MVTDGLLLSTGVLFLQPLWIPNAAWNQITWILGSNEVQMWLEPCPISAWNCSETSGGCSWFSGSVSLIPLKAFLCPVEAVCSLYVPQSLQRFQVGLILGRWGPEDLPWAISTGAKSGSVGDQRTHIEPNAQVQNTVKGRQYYLFHISPIEVIISYVN